MRRTLLFLATICPALMADDAASQALQVLAKNCVACHGAGLKSAGLDLRTRDGMLTGGERGAALVPGNSQTSRIYRAAAGLEQPTMPPGKKLPEADLEAIRKWIDAGAPGSEAKPVEVPDASEALRKMEERPITEEDRQFRSFRPVKRPAVPAEVRNPVDYFLAQAWLAKGLKPSPPAPRHVLIRRAYLDLTGLPPKPEEVEAFVKDQSPDAFAHVVERLLASPQYGERWARHWLDLVRYSDSGGYEFDRDRHNAWRYRDYVIRAFNTDKPYDRFIREQIAGDELYPDSHDAIIATGYLRMGPEANIKTEQTRMDELDDIVSTTGATFLGVTIGCARCHNHKFDPIPQKDYYRIQAVFFPATAAEVPLVSEEERAQHKAAMKRFEDAIAPLKQELEKLAKPYRERLIEEKKSKLPDYVQLALKTPPDKRSEGQKLNAEQVEKTLRVDAQELERAMPSADAERHCELRTQIRTVELSRPRLVTALGIAERGGPKPPPSHFLHHGSVGQKGSVMKPGVLSVAQWADPEWTEPPADAKSSWRRRAFAEWVAAPQNPLTARVMVNRIWQHHFGEGIVRSPNNFGKTGDAPTHPELLDWLASEFIKQGWSVKAMHRLLMNSDAYRMSSDDIPANRAIDPDNRLLSRMPRRRLEAEALRDAVLAVAGTLNTKSGGPGVHPFIDPSLWASSSGRHWPGRPDDDPETWRRSVYIFSKRTIPVPMLEVFDRPDSIGSCARRNRSTIATQALILMNNSVIVHHSGKFAERLRRETDGSAAAMVERAFELALSRQPTTAEKAAAVDFVSKGKESLVDFCQAMVNLNEFAYIQ